MTADAPVARRWWAFRSIRARSTLVAVLVVAAALTAGALGLLSILSHALTESVEHSDDAQLASVQALWGSGPLPSLLLAGRGDIYTQVVVGGRVVAASPTVATGAGPFVAGPTGQDGVVFDSIPILPGAPGTDGDVTERGAHDRDGPWLVVAAPAKVGGSPAVVEVAGSLRSVEVGEHAAVGALVVGLPVLVGLVALLVWEFTGRALRPVEAVREEVADITLRQLDRRVPVPDTGDEVSRLARTMNSMLDRLESSAEGQRRFVADASHELRSPLAALQANLEVLRAHPDGPDADGAIGDALAEADRLRALVEDLLVLATAEEAGNGRPPRQELVDLDELVLAEAARTAPLGGPSIDLSRVSGGRVRGDAAQLGRVVRNLLDNARRHADSGVQVEVGGDETVLLAVSDDGPGVPPEERERIFERFGRLDEARSVDDGGTGLGLAIVSEIVLAHGGTVTVGDADPGARFEVRLPAADREG